MIFSSCRRLARFLRGRLEPKSVGNGPDQPPACCLGPRSFLAAGLLAVGLCSAASGSAQTFVTPSMGGGRVAADMVHIDLYYDADANQLHAHVDDSFGVPELRALEPDYQFDPAQPYAVLNGKAYNSQYGWNVGGFFTLPPGAAIWIELVDASPGLETYSGWGRLGSYAPILGTAGSSRLWKWSGVMVHNTYAIQAPPVPRLYAEYHVYLGDANTGSRIGFMDLDDTTVRLEWTTVAVEDPLTFRIGAGQTNSGAPLMLLNADQFATNGGTVVDLHHTNAGPWAFEYGRTATFLILPATEAYGGPATNSAALGANLELEFVSLAGPRGGALRFREPLFEFPVGATSAAPRVVLSQGGGMPGSDPYGLIPGRVWSVTQPGLYCLGFRLVDTSTNGPAGGPIHAVSPTYYIYLQAGLTVNSVTRDSAGAKVSFVGEPGKTVFLQRRDSLGSGLSWQTVAGPLAGTNRVQVLSDPSPASGSGFYRLKVE